MPHAMRDAFREHHRPTDAEFKAIWSECTFALDANVLLNVYRYATPTRHDFFRILSHLSDRIWVPYHAAAEFYRNRLDVIREQSAKYDQLATSVTDVLFGLSDGSFRKSGFLKLSELEQLLKPAVTQATAFIAEQRASHPDLLDDDPFLEQLAAIVGTSLGGAPARENLEQSSKDAQDRIDRLQPPGFRDAKKPAPARFGDVFIWFELLQLGKDTGRPVLFVTDDDKEDWWQVVGGRKLGPRPELREEMRKVAGVEFALYNPARLMERVGSELTEAVPESSINDARKIAEELQARNAIAHDADASQAFAKLSGELRAPLFRLIRDAELAVEKWLIEQRPSGIVHRRDRDRHDFLIVDGHHKQAVDVKIVRDERMIRTIGNRLRDAGYRAHYETASGLVDSYLVVIVAPTLELSITLADRIESIRSGPTPQLSVGFLDEACSYCELTTIDPKGD